MELTRYSWSLCFFSPTPKSTRDIGYAVRIPGGAVHDLAEKEIPMKKIAVRKAGTVRLTSAAASAYCCGTA